MTISSLPVPPASPDRLDCVALGEVMLRLDPGEHRIRQARTFDVWEGGGEYNVVQALSSCFGHGTAILTSLVDNEIGRLLEGLIRRSGVATDWIRWVPHDGMGQAARNGLYFMERGFGARGATAVMDRAHTAIAQLSPEDLDWSGIFSQARPRWFHVGGVMAGLSEKSPEVVKAAMIAAQEQGAIVSYDLNYRASLWAKRGGKKAALACNEELLEFADVVFGVHSLPHPVDHLDKEAFSAALQDMLSRYPNIKLAATNMRIIKDASHNDWSGMCLANGEFYAAKPYNGLPVLDRVGGGDAFAAGLIHGLLSNMGLQTAIELAAAHGALVMSTPGDNSFFSAAEVLAYAKGGEAAANR
ncbi:sugar kinase [Natronospirillum operosum]|uniref:Sugar kinase n=1 Tax=Natronospirillum operosum TaxID=2759953 RepID=A0A4Z0WE24_9GAMM|nr:sugar kinase [Natronospirillum operosum]TGG93416.1 sugar kinase [Natronospirillum operosum]